jgi:hypothetical protein
MKSLAQGVGQSRTASARHIPLLRVRRSGVMLSQFCDDAVGVGHIWTAMVSGIPIPLPFFAVSFTRSRRASQVSGFSPSCATLASGVGHDPNAIPPVGSANGGSRNAVPLRVIPERGQVSENCSKPSPKKCCDVLHDDVGWS